MKYRKKPLIIEAFQYGFDREPHWFASEIGKTIRYVPTNKRPLQESRSFPSDVLIKTLEGEMRANYYDFIIKGVAGEIYPCKADVFLATYEKVEG